MFYGLIFLSHVVKPRNFNRPTASKQIKQQDLIAPLKFASVDPRKMKFLCLNSRWHAIALLNTLQQSNLLRTAIKNGFYWNGTRGEHLACDSIVLIYVLRIFSAELI